ncbi:hypothetical protein GCM10027514_23680 [Azotobacter armeniacus]
MRLEWEDNGYRLTATVQDSWQLHWWLLSQSGPIAVRELQDLGENMKAGAGWPAGLSSPL